MDNQIWTQQAYLGIREFAIGIFILALSHYSVNLTDAWLLTVFVAYMLIPTKVVHWVASRRQGMKMVIDLTLLTTARNRADYWTDRALTIMSIMWQVYRQCTFVGTFVSSFQMLCIKRAFFTTIMHCCLAHMISFMTN
jgi:hypothetical protein